MGVANYSVRNRPGIRDQGRTVRRRQFYGAGHALLCCQCSLGLFGLAMSDRLAHWSDLQRRYVIDKQRLDLMPGLGQDRLRRGKSDGHKPAPCFTTISVYIKAVRHFQTTAIFKVRSLGTGWYLTILQADNQHFRC